MKRQRGQAFLEFAVIFPIFALMLFIVIDGGLLMGRYNNVNNSAKEGARLAAVGANEAEIVERIRAQAHGRLDDAPASCTTYNAGDEAICIEWVSGPTGQSPGTNGSSVRVRIRHGYDLITPLVSWTVGTWDMNVCAIQRLERSTSPPASSQNEGVTSCDD